MTLHSYDDNFLYLNCNTSEGARVGATYMQSKKAFRVPLSVSAIKEVKKLITDTRLDALLLREETKLEEILQLKSQNNNVSDKNARLRPYQAVDAEFLRKHTHAAVFNEQRTGKTPTILVAVKDKMKKGIVVCPAGLKLNWKNEIMNWIGRPSTVVKGSKSNRIGLYSDFYSGVDNILIISYETLRSDIDAIKKHIKGFDVMIADESHRLRNYKTKQSRAVFDLSKLAKEVYPLTGTPAVNHASDVFGMLHLLNPKKYTSYWQFVERYFVMTDGRYGRDVYGLRKDREAEFNEILQRISVQRKRKDVMAWIPKVTRRTIELEFNHTQRVQYQKALKEFHYGLEGEEQDIPNVLAQLTRLRQLCVDPKLLGIDAVSPKTEFIKEFINDTDGKIIIFSSFTSYLNELHMAIDGSVILTGEQSQKEKQEAIDAIQRGDGRVLLANIRAGGVGFTLDRADTVIFVDRSYNPVDNDQAADRFIPTQENKEYGTKEIIDLVMENSLEKRINDILDDKQNIISYVNDYIKKGGVLFGENE